MSRKPLIPVDEARSRILAGLRATPAEIVPLASAWQRVTAAPICARLNQPPNDVSAMDGYALRAADATLGAVLRVAGSAPAGHPWDGTLAPGEALRLFTGSVVPPEADTVLLQEDATRDGDRVTLNEAAAPGRHIRRAGQDFATGDVLLPAGRRLSARDIGLIAAGNHPWVTVHRRPRIGILATGDEIAMPGEPIPAGGIVSSNSHALAALVRACGGTPVVLPVAADDHDALSAAIDGAAGMEMLVTIGGASVGDHDLVQAALTARGFALDFWQIAMRPGKPLMFGRLTGDTAAMPVLGLPGNPVSSMVCAILFLLPALACLGGLPGAPPITVPAVLGDALKANDHRADHLRATLAMAADGSLTVRAFPRQDSAMMRLLAQADALIVRPPNAPAAPAGSLVPVILLDRLGV